MKTLKDLTSEIEAKIPHYINNALQGVSDGERYNNFNLEKAKKCVEWNYKKCGFSMPLVLVAENPYEMQLLFNFCKLLINKGSQLGSQLDSQLYSQLDSQLYSQLGSQLGSQLKKIYTYNSSYLFTMNFYSDCYYTWYEFIRKELNIPLSINNDFQKCFKLQRESGVCQAIFSKEICVVSKYPKKVYWSDENLMHNTKGKAIEWGAYSDSTKFDCYYINGRNVPSNLFEKGFTKQDFIAEQNEDVRGAMFEIIEGNGEGSMLEFLEAKETHKETLVHKNGEMEEISLYRTKESFKELTDLNGNKDVPLAWLKIVCPSTGQNYLINTDPSFETASEAIKYHRPADIPFELEYSWSSRS